MDAIISIKFTYQKIETHLNITVDTPKLHSVFTECIQLEYGS